MWNINWKVKKFFRLLLREIRCQNVNEWIYADIILHKLKITVFKGTQTFLRAIDFNYLFKESRTET